MWDVVTAVQVGVDPVLRAKLWHHLRDIAEKDNVTIIITTHYIEEARYVQSTITSYQPPPIPLM